MIEHNVNQAAVQLGLDTIDMRLRSVLRPGDMDPKLNLPVEEYRAAEAIQRGRERFRWDEKIAADKAFNDSNRRYRRGVGIGCGGPDFKDLRRRFTSNLTGYCAFPDQGRADKHKAKYAELRRIRREEREATAEPAETESDTSGKE